MTPWLLPLLCDPETREPLTLENTCHDAQGNIDSGTLRSPGGRTYPITKGIPRFVKQGMKETVQSFGDQWNHFNFVQLKLHWESHAVANTFGSTEAFRDKVIVDAGGGSGAQTLWMLESGAKHVIMLELSHSVDEVVQRNLRPWLSQLRRDPMFHRCPAVAVAQHRGNSNLSQRHPAHAVG
jgi:uncharacterized protein YbaR (Trm112 family)